MRLQSHIPPIHLLLLTDATIVGHSGGQIQKAMIEGKAEPYSRGEMLKQSNEGEVGRRRGFLRLPQVLEIIPISKSSWWKGIKEGRFPKPVKLSERTSAWLRTDIDALCDRFAVEAPSGVEKPVS